jgi:hypothetical protein
LQGVINDRWNVQEVAKASDVGDAVAVGKQPIVTNAVEALREDVDQETADELMGLDQQELGI